MGTGESSGLGIKGTCFIGRMLGQRRAPGVGACCPPAAQAVPGCPGPRCAGPRRALCRAVTCHSLCLQRPFLRQLGSPSTHDSWCQLCCLQPGPVAVCAWRLALGAQGRPARGKSVTLVSARPTHSACFSSPGHQAALRSIAGQPVLRPGVHHRHVGGEPEAGRVHRDPLLGHAVPVWTHRGGGGPRARVPVAGVASLPVALAPLPWDGPWPAAGSWSKPSAVRGQGRRVASRAARPQGGFQSKGLCAK